MQMPGRHGYSTQGGWAQGGNGISGVPATLSISSRVSNTPPEYRASESIEFVAGFESGAGDSFETFITQDAGSTGSGSGGVYAGGGYRYGFNGKEEDDELKGEGNSLDFGARIYDPRISRFLSTDKRMLEAPETTPYSYADNVPIALLDANGNEGEPGFTIKTTSGQVNVKRPLTQNISRGQLEKFVAERVNEIMPPKPQRSVGAKIVSTARWLLKFANAANIATGVLTYDNSGGGHLYERLGAAKYSEYITAQGFLFQQQTNPTSNHFEILTDNPANLPDWYAAEVKQRLMNGTASVNDQNYKDELIDRGMLASIFGQKQNLGKKADSRILGSNLEKAGHVRPGVAYATAAHHIVEGTDKRADNARKILHREGIDINDADNGVFLDVNHHRKLHTDDYRQKVFDRINGAQPGKVREELRKIASELKSQTF